MIMIGFGMLRLGDVTEVYSSPVDCRFYFRYRLDDFLHANIECSGTDTGRRAGSFIGKWGAYFGGIDTVNWYAVGITIVTVLIAVYMPKITSKVPGSFVAILVVTPIVAFLLPEGAVTTIGSEFGRLNVI